MGRKEKREDEGPARFQTGTLYLDEILHGGWLRGGVYILGGPPGTGKTTLANQIAYTAADRGETTVYVTMFAETHDRMTLHLATLGFFDKKHVGTRVHYLGGSAVLKRDGLQGFTKYLGGLMRNKRAQLMVIDGFNAVREYTDRAVDLREHLQGLSVYANINGCTVIILTNDDSKSAAVEHGMVDGVLAMSAELHGLKATRGLEVIKFRGSGNIPGKHTLRIEREGVKIYPRFEASFTTPSTKVPDPADRISWGISDLDVMSGGGLVRLSSTLIFGSPGSGKTVVGMNFLAEGARRGEKCLYLGFAETGAELMLKTRNLGLALDSYVKKGSVRLEVRAPVETLPDALAQELTMLVDEPKYTRLFLDGLEPFAKEALDPERTTRFITAMINSMRERGVTLLVSQQTNDLFGPQLHAPIRGVEAICDNVVFLRFFELHARLHRMIALLKMRDSANDPYLRELHLTAEGVRVGDAFANVEALMTGQPRGPTEGPAPALRSPASKRRKKVR
jgi:circadian clock protein KaiC